MILIGFKANGQIVNVESLRKVSDTSKWSGNISLDLGLIKNSNSSFRMASGAHIQFTNKKNLVLIVNNLKFQQVDENKFVNRGIQHFRYNYRFRPKIAWELFTQGQYDAISDIDFRGLIGTGPRFKLGSSEKNKFNLGALLMYEYEKTSEINEDMIYRDIRGSAYLAFSIHPGNHVSLVSTTYYQPKLSQFGDYRISSDTSLSFQIFKDLGFKSTFSLNFDSLPAEGIPNTQYEFTNGLVFSFD
ncbi:MAG: DUF481 domain-containing protein [Aurantibacter sp.]